MPESWLQREILAPRRLIFNVLWYGTHLGVFAYGWYSQASFSFILGIFLSLTPSHRLQTRNSRPSMRSSSPSGRLVAPA